jgi:hypothetical protein
MAAKEPKVLLLMLAQSVSTWNCRCACPMAGADSRNRRVESVQHVLLYTDRAHLAQVFVQEAPAPGVGTSVRILALNMNTGAQQEDAAVQ